MEGCEELVFRGWKKEWRRIGTRRGAECGRLRVRCDERQVACARCLDAGPDDVIAKPFAFTEPAARICAVLRRSNHAVRVRLQVYINYLLRKADPGHDRALIRIVRGTGYQIGYNGFVS